jgi:hypothetical protein
VVVGCDFAMLLRGDGAQLRVYPEGDDFSVLVSQYQMEGFHRFSSRSDRRMLLGLMDAFVADELQVTSGGGGLVVTDARGRAFGPVSVSLAFDPGWPILKREVAAVSSGGFVDALRFLFPRRRAGGVEMMKHDGRDHLRRGRRS